MARPTLPILVLVIFLALMIAAEGRHIFDRQQQTLHKRQVLDSRQLLQQLLVHYRGRVLDTDRRSPTGPDPQHH
ncbi:hypothetical protein FF1_046869 [Malus domestica]|uniref:Uncharacterized protein n=1 Tax=Malus domestica TaxID=3750 RepID=A0A498J4G5_MALDO|nr:hypothetical protein DVH24_035154 [Malus domestica]